MSLYLFFQLEMMSQQAGGGNLYCRWVVHEMLHTILLWQYSQHLSSLLRIRIITMIALVLDHFKNQWPVAKYPGFIRRWGDLYWNGTIGVSGDYRTRSEDQEQSPCFSAWRSSKKATEESLARAGENLRTLVRTRKEAEQKVADEHGKVLPGSRWRRRCCLWRKDWSRWFWLWLRFLAGLFEQPF